jgi:hypothetical protein
MVAVSTDGRRRVPAQAGWRASRVLSAPNVDLLAIHPRIPERLGVPRKYAPSFGAQGILHPPPIDFPREPMEPALAEHARLLRAHAHEIMHAVTEDECVADGLPFAGVEDVVAVIAADGELRDVRAWYREDASWVVRRCHGIVRKLIEQPRAWRFYAMVIAGGVASLHLMTGTGEPDWEPGVRYTREGLGVKVIARNLVAEPWEQWHRRRGGRVRTTWELPGGARGEGEVEIPARPRTFREAADRTVALYAGRIASELAWFEDTVGSRDRIVWIRSRREQGDTVSVFPYELKASLMRQELPVISGLLLRRRKGYDPVLVHLDHAGALRWLPRAATTDAGAPAPVNELRTDCGD